MACTIMLLYVDTIITLLGKKHFSEAGTSQRMKEEATYMLFIDLLHQCEGGVLFLYYSVHDVLISAMSCVPYTSWRNHRHGVVRCVEFFQWITVPASNGF